MKKMLLLLFCIALLNSKDQTQSDLLTYAQVGQRVTLIATPDTQQSTFASRNTGVLHDVMELINNHGVIEIYPGTYPLASIGIPAKVILNFKSGGINW